MKTFGLLLVHNQGAFFLLKYLVIKKSINLLTPHLRQCLKQLPPLYSYNSNNPFFDLNYKFNKNYIIVQLKLLEYLQND